VKGASEAWPNARQETNAKLHSSSPLHNATCLITSSEYNNAHQPEKEPPCPSGDLASQWAQV